MRSASGVSKKYSSLLDPQGELLGANRKAVGLATTAFLIIRSAITISGFVILVLLRML